MLSPNIASILCYHCSLGGYWSFFVETLDSCSRFLKHIMFLVETRQSDFAELRPFRRQSETQWILDSFEERIKKRIHSGFGTKIEIENIFNLFWNNLLASLSRKISLNFLLSDTLNTFSKDFCQWWVAHWSLAEIVVIYNLTSLDLPSLLHVDWLIY